MTADSHDIDDKTLFRKAMRGVKRSQVSATPLQRPKPRAVARFARLDEAEVLRESLGSDDRAANPGDSYVETGDEVSFKRAGVQDTVLKKLRRGQFRLEEEIDLHGLNVEEAKSALREFFLSVRGSRVRCVRIIHGKGNRSGNRGPVLKTAVNGLLQRTDAVLAYTSARQVDGGTGAVYVLLRSTNTAA